MAKFKLLFLLIPAIIVCIAACKEEPYEPIDAELLPYIESFIFEANERDFNLSIDSLGIEVKFENISDPSVIGRCQRNEDGENESIAVDPIYWKLATELEKEYVMFHELGHCVLNRPHTTAADASNICLSIMEPGTGELCTSNYNETTREVLLDELFTF